MNDPLPQQKTKENTIAYQCHKNWDKYQLFHLQCCHTVLFATLQQGRVGGDSKPIKRQILTLQGSFSHLHLQFAQHACSVLDKVFGRNITCTLHYG